MTLATFRGPVVYVDDLDRPALSADDRHHLERVLRVRPGQEIALCDGNGSWQRFRFDRELRSGSDRNFDKAPEQDVSVSVAVVKGDRPDWMVQKLTEVGVDRLLLVATDHSVVTWPADRVSRNLDRFRRIAAAAAAQSHRSRLPQIEGVLGFEAAAVIGGSVLAEPGGGPLPEGTRNILVGPEGGWSEAERRHNLATIGLGDHILRTETAAVAAATLLVMVRSRLVVPAPPRERNALCG